MRGQRLQVLQVTIVAALALVLAGWAIKPSDTLAHSDTLTTNVESPLPTPTFTSTPDLRDAYEPDDVTARLVALGEIQSHNFFPEGDVDKLRFLAKSGRYYRVQTLNLALGVDTALTLNAGTLTYTNDDRAIGDLSSDIAFQAAPGADVDAIVTITDRGQYGAGKTYQVMVQEIIMTPTPTSPPPPTATPTSPPPTPSPTPTPTTSPPTPTPTPTSPPMGATWFGFDPARYEISSPNGLAHTVLQISEVSNLTGVEVWIKFDPNIVQVKELTLGPILRMSNALIITNEIDNAEGRLKLAAALPSTAAFNGTGGLVTITWKGKAVGQSALTLEKHELSRSNGQPIPHTTRPGALSVSSVTAQVSGVVLLQGRTSHGGTEVLLYEETCPASFSALTIDVPGAQRAVTDALGTFQASSEGKSFQCLMAFRGGYLAGKASGTPLSGSLGTLTLPGGDVAQDGRINIFDLTLIAARAYTSDPVADLNGDGLVNIYDLATAASNLGTVGPVSNWRP